VARERAQKHNDALAHAVVRGLVGHVSSFQAALQLRQHRRCVACAVLGHDRHACARSSHA
jgi:hypothetical protein